MIGPDRIRQQDNRPSRPRLSSSISAAPDPSRDRLPFLTRSVAEAQGGVNSHDHPLSTAPLPHGRGSVQRVAPPPPAVSRQPASAWVVLRRGAGKRCPRCGLGRLFRSWYTLHNRCAECGLLYEPAEGNSWWFMYYSTALFTGVIVVGMLLLTPDNLWLGRAVVVAAWLAMIFLSMPYRKGLAIAIDHLSERFYDSAR